MDTQSNTDKWLVKKDFVNFQLHSLFKLIDLYYPHTQNNTNTHTPIQQTIVLVYTRFSDFNLTKTKLVDLPLLPFTTTFSSERNSEKIALPLQSTTMIEK